MKIVFSATWILTGMVVLSALTVHARIFSQRPVASAIPGVLQSLGGKIAYAAPIRINGGSATLTVTGFEDPMNTRSQDIRTALNLTTPAIDDSDSLNIIESGDNVTRLLLLHLPATGKTLAVSMEQSRRAYQESKLPSPRFLLTTLPAFPGSTPGFYAENENTDLQFATLTSSASAAEIAAFYRSTLSAAGWEPMFPSTDPLAASLFLRDHALCYVLITPLADRNTCHITLLRKSLKNPTP